MSENRHVDVGGVALFGLMDNLVRSRPHLSDEEASPGRGEASNHDALQAVVQLATAIDIPAQAGDLDPEQAHRMASLLLVIRDYIEPIVTASDDDEGRKMRRYLNEVLANLRR